MSWSASCRIPAGSMDTDPDTYELLMQAPVFGNGELPVERNLAMSAAALAAADLIDSGALGDPNEYEFQVMLAGHVNPGNVLAGCPDTITVSVTQVPREVPDGE